MKEQTNELTNLVKNEISELKNELSENQNSLKKELSDKLNNWFIILIIVTISQLVYQLYVHF
jgi:hypothetical protein